MQKVEEFLLEPPSETWRPGQGRACSLECQATLLQLSFSLEPPSFPGGEGGRAPPRGNLALVAALCPPGVKSPTKLQPGQVPGNLAGGESGGASQEEALPGGREEELCQGPASSSQEGS